MHPWCGKGGKWPEGGPPRPHGPHHGGPHHGGPHPGPPHGHHGPPGEHHGKWGHHHQRREEERNRIREEITQQMSQQMNETLNQKMAEFTSKMLQQQQQQQTKLTDAMVQQMNQQKQAQIIQQSVPPPQPVQTPPQPIQTPPPPIIQSQIISTVQPANVQPPSTSTVQKSENLVESQIIENTSEILKIQEIKPTPETHKIIMIHQDQFSFPIIPYDEKYEEEESQLDLKNSEIQGYVIGQIKREFPHCEFGQTLCQNHCTQIEYVCLEEQCRQKNKYLMCPKCVKYHKQHNFQELSEIIFFGQQRMQQFNDTDILIAKMEVETQFKLKILKSKNIEDLGDIEKIFQEGFDELKIQMKTQKELYHQIMINMQQGGLGNLQESISFIFASQQPSSSNIIQSSLYLKGFISKLEQAEEQLKQYEHLVLDLITNIKPIKVDNYDFQIDFQKVETCQDLYQQIKIQLIKEDLQNLIYRELLWLRENEAIKLQGNDQAIDQNCTKNVQIVSYQQF